MWHSLKKTGYAIVMLFCVLNAELNYWQALGQTVEWFRKALAVEPVKGNLRLSGYSACGQDGGVQLPHAYIEGNLPL